MPVTSADEPFEVFSASGEPLGIEPRGKVHRLGLWHRSSHVFLFDQQQRLLLQQRSQEKDLYPGAWDYSVGEHLQPGETYLAAALRGMQEEMGITLEALAMESLGAPTAAEYIEPGGAQIDREFQQAFRARLPEALGADQIKPDPNEVAQASWYSAAEVRAQLAHNPGQFTPWFVRDVRRFELV
ncbi:MAG: NUDIX hydrolase [Pseudomonadales bacterium]